MSLAFKLGIAALILSAFMTGFHIANGNYPWALLFAFLSGLNTTTVVVQRNAKQWN